MKIKPYHGQGFTPTMYIDVERISGDLYNEKMSTFEHYIGGIAEVAYGAVVDAEEQIIKAGLYKQQVKLKMNRALHAYQAMQRDSLSWHNFRHADYWVTYVDAYAMCIAPLADRFEKNIRQVCVNYRKLQNGEAKAAVILAYNWLAIAESCFDTAVNDIRNESGYDFRDRAPFRNIGRVKKEIGNVFELIYDGPTINMNEYKGVRHAADLIFDYVADKESVDIPGLASAILHKDKYPSLAEHIGKIRQDSPRLYRKAEVLAAQL